MSKHVMSCHVMYCIVVLWYRIALERVGFCCICGVATLVVYVRYVEYVMCAMRVCVCTCTTLNPKDFECMQSKRSRGRRERHWQLSQRRLPVTGHENAPANERGGCTWVVVTACGPYEEFLGPSWQLESSPLGSASVFFRAELKASRI